MDDDLPNYDSLCPHHGLFIINYSKEIIYTLTQVERTVNDVYGIFILFLSPINIAANIFSGVILIKKELRNPFNIILSIMCLTAAIPLLLQSSFAYRKVSITECSAQTETYSIALHNLIILNSLVPFRAAYTWITVFLTILRYKALKSKGKWEATYPLATVGTILLSGLSASAGIPMYMVNVIGELSIEEACLRAALPGEEGLTVPEPMWSPTFFDNNCLIFNINQLVSGIIHNTLPSLILLGSTIMLTLELGKARKGHNAVTTKSSKGNDDAVKAARMLTVVAILTLLSELPQGIISLSVFFFPLGYQWHYVDRLTRVWVTIQLITTSCNLLIYLVMSKNFRKAVIAMFCSRCRQTKTLSPQPSVISASTTVKQSRF
ncbi:hypothetical protein PRIPAC_82382 [Pristionchus pacificus]|uniref:G_PROTEIN_RECEP_F1_2 domain-containing protein n=1 Tax=Pristionchus pacificus TaxID=54126 RepID=A0A2A6BVQ3_PRIPA|nr:hypothetical protein PRIPAC_82382 [Pristionchus pacificus]|eukprot:PDM69906.1 hypothetical protein PRIPAC_49118 [Pristionchus pacificus]